MAWTLIAIGLAASVAGSVQSSGGLLFPSETDLKNVIASGRAAVTSGGVTGYANFVTACYVSAMDDPNRIKICVLADVVGYNIENRDASTDPAKTDPVYYATDAFKQRMELHIPEAFPNRQAAYGYLFGGRDAVRRVTETLTKR